MPLVRLQVKNEFGLGGPELYRDANRDDPKALLDGVAVAGLVGILRQLGDLAEYVFLFNFYFYSFCFFSFSLHELNSSCNFFGKWGGEGLGARSMFFFRSYVRIARCQQFLC